MTCLQHLIGSINPSFGECKSSSHASTEAFSDLCAQLESLVEWARKPRLLFGQSFHKLLKAATTGFTRRELQNVIRY